MQNNTIDQYCMTHSDKESLLLQEIREYTYKHEQAPAMISGPLVVNTLKNIIQLSNANSILEIGMFTGYSAAGMAEVLPNNGHIDTCELCPIHAETAQKFFNQSNYQHKITIHIGNAIDTLQTFSKNSFDMIFIDADKINYIKYYKMAMVLLKSKGIIILDNMLWSGDVVNPTSKEAETLNELNNIITEDSRNSNTLLPIRDGLMICIKK
tara:strand:+ start:6711 stop:7340 length:630 start_codon:yes stop_codon:yes gene_type:complete